MPTVPRSLRLILPLAAVLLIAGHLWFWYLPRERTARFGDTDLSLRMIEDTSGSTALWIPYPHQNLAMLARSTGDRQEYLAALFRVIGSAPPTLPRFGPLALPPARELVVAVDPEGDRLAVAVEVYPSVAIFARLAGLVAGNPWLKGGAVQMGERSATVTWKGNLWTVATGDSSFTAGGPAPPEDSAETAGPASEALAVLRAPAPPEPLPSGLYRLARRGAALEIVQASTSPERARDQESTQRVRDRRLPQRTHDQELSERVRDQKFSQRVRDQESPLDERDVVEALLELCARPAVEGLWMLERMSADGSEARAVAITLGDLTSTLGLPEVATLSRGSVAAWSLPGVDLLRMLTGGGARRREGDWRLEAFTEQGLERAALLVPSMQELLAAPTASRLVLSGSLDLDAERSLLEGLIGLADSIPLVPGRYRRFLQDVQTLGRPLDGFDRAALVIQEDPATLTLRLRPIAGKR